MCILWLVIHSPTLSPEGYPCAPPTSVPEEASFPRHLPTTGIFLLFKFANLRDKKVVFYTHLHFLFSGEWKHFFPPVFLSHLNFVYYKLPVYFLCLLFFQNIFLLSNLS